MKINPLELRQKLRTPPGPSAVLTPVLFLDAPHHLSENGHQGYIGRLPRSLAPPLERLLQKVRPTDV